MKKRSTLKLLLELYFVGVVEDGDVFLSIIEDLTSVEHLMDTDATQMNLSLLASFVREGQTFLGLPLSGHEILDEVKPFFFRIILPLFNLSILNAFPFHIVEHTSV